MQTCDDVKTVPKPEQNASFRPGLRTGDGPRILTLDIETTPIESHVWGLFDQTIGLNQIRKDWMVLSVAWKWLGSDQVHYADTWGSQFFDDGLLCARVWSLLDEADIVIGHNAKRFDVRKLNSRFLQLGFQPYRPIHVIDTKTAASALAMNTSNKLEYLADKIGESPKSTHKKFPGHELWTEYLNRNPEARAEMERYNKQDVVATENLYLKLRPWIKGHPNVSHYYDDDETRCPRCGGKHLHAVGTEYLKVNGYMTYRCGDCGGIARVRKTSTPKTKRENLLNA